MLSGCVQTGKVQESGGNPKRGGLPREIDWDRIKETYPMEKYLMNKNLRFLFVVILLAGILLAAGSKAVWATPASDQPKAAAAKAAGAPVAVAPVGSVLAPNCDGVNIKAQEQKSVCGVALVTGLSDADVFATLNGMPDGFLSQAVTLLFKQGSAQICFAAPNGGTIFFMASSTFDWLAIPTDLNNGFACSTVASNGDYALGKTPAP